MLAAQLFLFRPELPLVGEHPGQLCMCPVTLSPSGDVTAFSSRGAVNFFKAMLCRSPTLYLAHHSFLVNVFLIQVKYSILCFIL